MPRLLEQVQNLIRIRHYSYRTEQTTSTGLNNTSWNDDAVLIDRRSDSRAA